MGSCLLRTLPNTVYTSYHAEKNTVPFRCKVADGPVDAKLFMTWCPAKNSLTKSDAWRWRWKKNQSKKDSGQIYPDFLEGYWTGIYVYCIYSIYIYTYMIIHHVLCVFVFDFDVLHRGDVSGFAFTTVTRPRCERSGTVIIFLRSKRRSRKLLRCNVWPTSVSHERKYINYLIWRRSCIINFDFFK